MQEKLSEELSRRIEISHRVFAVSVSGRPSIASRYTRIATLSITDTHTFTIYDSALHIPVDVIDARNRYDNEACDVKDLRPIELPTLNEESSYEYTKPEVIGIPESSSQDGSIQISNQGQNRERTYESRELTSELVYLNKSSNEIKQDPQENPRKTSSSQQKQASQVNPKSTPPHQTRIPKVPIKITNEVKDKYPTTPTSSPPSKQSHPSIILAAIPVPEPLTSPAINPSPNTNQPRIITPNPAFIPARAVNPNLNTNLSPLLNLDINPASTLTPSHTINANPSYQDIRASQPRSTHTHTRKDEGIDNELEPVMQRDASSHQLKSNDIDQMPNKELSSIANSRSLSRQADNGVYDIKKAIPDADRSRRSSLELQIVDSTLKDAKLRSPGPLDHSSIEDSSMFHYKCSLLQSRIHKLNEQINRSESIKSKSGHGQTTSKDLSISFKPRANIGQHQKDSMFGNDMQSFVPRPKTSNLDHSKFNDSLIEPSGNKLYKIAVESPLQTFMTQTEGSASIPAPESKRFSKIQRTYLQDRLGDTEINPGVVNDSGSKHSHKISQPVSRRNSINKSTYLNPEVPKVDSHHSNYFKKQQKSALDYRVKLSASSGSNIKIRVDDRDKDNEAADVSTSTRNWHKKPIQVVRHEGRGIDRSRQSSADLKKIGHFTRAFTMLSRLITEKHAYAFKELRKAPIFRDSHNRERDLRAIKFSKTEPQAPRATPTLDSIIQTLRSQKRVLHSNDLKSPHSMTRYHEESDVHSKDGKSHIQLIKNMPDKRQQMIRDAETVAIDFEVGVIGRLRNYKKIVHFINVIESMQKVHAFKALYL